MSITHDYIAQELHHERAGGYERDVVAARLVKPVVRRPRSRPAVSPGGTVCVPRALPPDVGDLLVVGVRLRPVEQVEDDRGQCRGDGAENNHQAAALAEQQTNHGEHDVECAEHGGSDPRPTLAPSVGLGHPYHNRIAMRPMTTAKATPNATVVSSCSSV